MPDGCTLAAEDRPEVEPLLAELSISPEDFAVWYCAGAGLGDLRRAHAVAEETDQSPEELLERFLAGEGWGDLAAPGRVEPGGREAQCLQEHADHPEVRNIARDAPFTQEQVLAWFCEGYGFGDLRNAYDVHTAVDAPVEDLLEMVDDGMEWDAIRRQLGAPSAPGPEGTD